MANESPLLKLEEVARRLNTSVCTARRLCETGKINALNIGIGKHKVWRVRAEDLEDFVPTKKAAPPPRGYPMGMLKIV